MDLDNSSEWLRPIVTGWANKIELARKARAKWQEIADECMLFYSKSAAAMWSPEYGRKFWKGVPAPRFRVTINKAFEMVATFGPNLIWDTPHRKVEPKRLPDIPIEIFGDPQQPQVQSIYQQVMAEYQQETMTDRMISYLMQAWLNYTPREMPGGGLESHSMLAVIDALIKGRGVIWVKPYRFPFSGRTMTGCFREPPENVFLDPDYTTPDEAKWIAIRRIEPIWEVERRFNLPKDSLKDRATLESSWHEGEMRTDGDYLMRRRAGQTNDMMEYYEVWSKTGPGSRLTGMDTVIREHLEETVGDYAWIVVAPNVPYPLNLPSQGLRGGMSTQEVRTRLQWPVECFRDDRWPVEFLDFYPDPECAWPVAPLAPALGELKFLNVMIPHLMNRIWSSSRDFWAVVQPAYNDFMDVLKKGEDQAVFAMPPSLGNRVGELVQSLQQPQTNLDVWRIIEAVSELFDRRTGLTEFTAGMNTGGTQDRTAETTMARKSQAGVRPQYMAKVVAKFQSRLASLEAFCAHSFVIGEDVLPLLGQTGAKLWDTFIQGEDLERVARQMNYTIEAASIRRPDKDRDIANINQAVGVWLPVAAQAAGSSGNYEPVNNMMKKWGEAADMNMDDLAIPPATQNEEAMQLQQQQMQLEMQKLQMEAQKMQAELQGKQLDLQAKVLDSQLKQQGAQMSLQGKAAEAQLKLQTQQAEASSKLQQQRSGLFMELMGQRANLAADEQQSEQELRQDQEQHRQEMLQSALTFAQKLRQEQELGKVKTALARKAVTSNGKTNKTGSK